MHVPQPEVRADETNPKGFAETHVGGRPPPRAAAALPRPGLRRAADAWYETGKASASGITRARLTEWLGPHFREAGSPIGEEPAIDELVIKDPRLAWFLGLWKSAALRTDAQASYVTMLRHVTEVVGSKQRYYSQARPTLQPRPAHRGLGQHDAAHRAGHA